MTQRIGTAATVLVLFTALQGQGNLPYPTEDYFGGGIGYTPMFLSIDIAQAFPFNVKGADGKTTGLLTSGMGFSDEEISGLGNLLVIHGAEGFGNITGHWRIGAYVGLGARSIARVDSATNSRTDLKVSLSTGNISLEVVAPIFSNLEISAGSLFGFSRATIQASSTLDEPDWEKQIQYTDSSNTSVTLSGRFFSFQPYVAMKLQFLNRAGLRMSAGYQVGTLATDQWTLNGFKRILSPSAGNFNALAVRLMLYIGI
ncbi:MAG: hypothetical protein IID15_03865 [Candidatus Marinimicrobia bacterium]|nr:hypothetical protein [Candidatus Neomarinimicrobiota bacterium]